MELRWSYQAGQNLLARPLYHQNQIYLSARRYLIALAADSGAEIWRITMPRATSATPLLFEGRLLVSCEDGHLHHFALNDGRLLDSWSLGHPAGHGPIRAGDGVIATCGGTRPGQQGGSLIAFDNCGRQRWNFCAPLGFHSRAVADEERVYAANRDGKLYAVRLDDGSLVWSLANPGELFATAVLDREHLYFGTQDGAVVCATRARGEIVWRREFGEPFFTREPVVHQELLLVPTQQGIEALECLSGATVWQHPASEAGPPALLDNRLVFGAGDGLLRALDPTSGELVWRWKSPRGPRGQQFAGDWLAPLNANELILATASLNQVLYALEDLS